MLPKGHRLKRREDVLRVRRSGKAWRHPLAVLLVVPAQARSTGTEGAELDAIPPARFAFSASRRVGSAVARNRGKRLLREAVRSQLETIEPGWDCLFIAREGTPQADFAEVRAAVQKLLSRARLIAAADAG